MSAFGNYVFFKRFVVLLVQNCYYKLIDLINLAYLGSSFLSLMLLKSH